MAADGAFGDLKACFCQGILLIKATRPVTDTTEPGATVSKMGRASVWTERGRVVGVDSNNENRGLNHGFAHS